MSTSNMQTDDVEQPQPHSRRNFLAACLAFP